MRFISPSRPIHLIFRAALVLALTLSAHADTHPRVDPHHIDASGSLKPVDLTANWLVHTGDDPTFASPTLDDSHWTFIDTANPLSDYGIAHPDFLWYRTHVHLQPNPHHLAILLNGFAGSEQIFVNGVLTGPSRDFPPGGLATANFDLRSPIPDALIASGDITIAIRAELKNTFANPNGAHGLRSISFVLLGDATSLDDSTSLYTFRYTVAGIANTALATLVLLIAIALAFTLRNEREYLFLCLYLAASVIASSITLWGDTHEVHRSRFYGVNILPLFVMFICGIEFARLILRIPRSRWIVLYEAALALMFLCYVTLTFCLPYGPPNRGWVFAFVVCVLIAIAPLNLGLPIFALWVWRRTSNFDALLLSVPLLIQSAIFYVQLALFILSLFHLATGGLADPTLHVFRLHWSQITDFFFLLGLLFFLIARTIRLARSRATLTAEIAAAATVQQLLLAGSSHPTPGFLVDSVYLPASNVGGDFFLVTTHPFDGSLIAVVGDVSGKGLTAAMRVAMILGVLRRETSHHPGDILASLNDAIIAQGELGFTTALCIRLFLNGDFILSNAGHISPYIAGAQSAATAVSREFLTPPALPLGLVLGEVYELQKGHLHPGEHIVLLSDGVPEARSRSGQLYGFDRLSNLTTLPAQDIAAVAQSFGQEDDITVLTLAIAT